MYMYINILDMYINVYINIFLMGGGWDKYKKNSLYLIRSRQCNICI